MVRQADTHSMRYTKALLLVVGLLALGLASCGDDSSEGPVISDAYVTTSSGAVAALYFTVENDGSADTLIEVSTDVPARASFHRNIVDGSTARMEAVDSVDIPADGKFAFVPADYHVMLDGLEDPLEDGSKVSVTAHFLHAGEVTFEAEVRTAGADGSDHDDHEDHDEHDSH